MEQSQLIPSNSFSSLVIHGLGQNNGSKVPLTFHRGISTPAETLFMGVNSITRPEGPPTRLPSKLPPPNDLRLEITLDSERLGQGRVGSVYPVSVTETPHSTAGLSLPPLVVKVAGKRRSDDVAREAWFYEEMECLQGISIARCYGFFQAELPEGHDILNWAEDDSDSEDETFSEDEGSGALSSDVEPHSNVTQNFVSVLVLERLGGHIPVGVPVDFIQPDVYEIYNDIAQLGIDHVDGRWRNVLQAPVTPESLVCPYHGHPHQWRIIDFDRASKTDKTISFADGDHQSWWRTIFASLPKGFVVDWGSPEYM